MTEQSDAQPQCEDSRNLPATVQAERYVAGVLNRERLDILAKSMPEHISPDRFKRNLIIAVAHHPKLLNCDPAAVFHEAGKASALGFYLDPALGEAYLITGWSKGGDVPQLRIGYRGLIKLARQSGQISKIYAHPVFANDPFKVTLGVDKTLYHEPDLWSDARGEMVGVYAVVHYSSGDYDFAVMNGAAVDRIRERSDGWKAFKTGRIKSTPWDTDYEEMALKTVLRKLCKTQPMSPEMAEAFSIEDRDYIDAEGRPVTPRLRPHEMLRQRRLAAGPGPGFDPAHIERELAGDKPADEGAAAAQGSDPSEDIAEPCEECGAQAGAPCVPVCSYWDEVDPLPPEVARARQLAAEDGQAQREFDRRQEAGEAATAGAEIETKPLTLAERAAGYEGRLRGAPNSRKLKSFKAANEGLRADLDRSDPERLAELDALFETLLSDLEERERLEAAAQASENARG